HQALVNTFQQLGPTAQSQEIRQLAAKGLPVLEQHLTLAQQVASQVGASVATAGQPETTSTGKVGNNNRAATGAKAHRNDQDYVREVWQGNQLEVELAQMAQQKARDSKVKDFANNVLNDFQNYRDRWASLASKNDITLPPRIGPKHKDKVDRLEKASNKQFDRVYIDIVKENLGSMLPYFQKEGRQGQLSAVRNLVNQELPVIQRHLDRVQTLDRQVTTASAEPNHKDNDKDKDKDRSVSNK